MHIMYALTARIVLTLLYAMQFLMFGRALMSWLAQDEDNKIYRFLFAATEPFVYPIRKLLSKFEFFNSMPIDMSFMVAIIVLMITTTLLAGSFV